MSAPGILAEVARANAARDRAVAAAREMCDALAREDWPAAEECRARALAEFEGYLDVMVKTHRGAAR